MLSNQKTKTYPNLTNQNIILKSIHFYPRSANQNILAHSLPNTLFQVLALNDYYLISSFTPPGYGSTALTDSVGVE